MGFLKSIGKAAFHAAVDPVTTVASAVANPVAAAKRAVHQYTGTADRHGWFAWLPPVNQVLTVLDRAKKAAPPAAPRPDALHGPR
ncbi:MAG: hypothetical protein K1X89_16620 [Myxococcaceae bacterium]|nr:hypothetical protein [Myxococcaceae bacterium]